MEGAKVFFGQLLPPANEVCEGCFHRCLSVHRAREGDLHPEGRGSASRGHPGGLHPGGWVCIQMGVLHPGGGGLHRGGMGVCIQGGEGVCIQGGMRFCIQGVGGLHRGGGVGKTPYWILQDTTGYSQRAGNSHPIGIHSCFKIFVLKWLKNDNGEAPFSVKILIISPITLFGHHLCNLTKWYLASFCCHSSCLVIFRFIHIESN